MEKRGLLSAAVLLWLAEQTDGPRHIDADEIQGLSGMLSKQCPAGLGGACLRCEREACKRRILYIQKTILKKMLLNNSIFFIQA
ncbi:MAG TPA: hypothetical protein PLQ95_12340, partial [Thiobacillus sp.]|nr:hypothetical protein [Thiobacillus sp.]